MTDPDKGIEVWDTGTLTLTSENYDDARGTLKTNNYTETINFQGTGTRGDIGTRIYAFGKSSQVQVYLAFSFIWDGGFGQDTIMSGLLSVSDRSGGESGVLILQGFTLQKP